LAACSFNVRLFCNLNARLAFTFLLLTLFGRAIASPEIKIGDKEFVRVTDEENSVNSLREYIPKGETLDHWNRLASVRIFKNQNDPKKFLGNLASVVSAKTPVNSCRFYRNSKTKDIVLEFLELSPPSDKLHCVEWNMMRAKFVDGTGLVVFQYAMRLYAPVDDTGHRTPIVWFSKTAPEMINAERFKMIGSFFDSSFEEIDEVTQSPVPKLSSVTPPAGQELRSH
jgi:hypothetical protein